MSKLHIWPRSTALPRAKEAAQRLEEARSARTCNLARLFQRCEELDRFQLALRLVRTPQVQAACMGPSLFSGLRPWAEGGGVGPSGDPEAERAGAAGAPAPAQCRWAGRQAGQLGGDGAQAGAGSRRASTASPAKPFNLGPGSGIRRRLQRAAAACTGGQAEQAPLGLKGRLEEEGGGPGAGGRVGGRGRPGWGRCTGPGGGLRRPSGWRQAPNYK